MADYLLSNKALDDLSEIWAYTFHTWSESQAEKYYYMLLDACQGLADGNVSGKTYAIIGKGIFGFKTGSHIIFYRKAEKEGIEVARILHVQMDLKNRMKE